MYSKVGPIINSI